MTLAEQLEALVDQHGLVDLLAEMAGICGEKAEHLRCNWQEEGRAKLWERAGRTLDKAADSMRMYGPCL